MYLVVNVRSQKIPMFLLEKVATTNSICDIAICAWACKPVRAIELHKVSSRFLFHSICSPLRCLYNYETCES